MSDKNATKVINFVNNLLIGKDQITKLSVVTLLAQGHLLLEDVPGVGKTTLANSIAKAIDCEFSRIQFTPDTLPSDVTGMSIYNPKLCEFVFVKGAVMSNIILADEINRTSPKTQASLLEAMEEKQVTVDSQTYKLEKPFMVIATQNPSDFLGTYNLPEAQLDRFMMRLSIGYPEAADEAVLTRNYLAGVFSKITESAVSKEELLKMQDDVKEVTINDDVLAYIISIVNQTRESKSIQLGASPRATIALTRACQALAFIMGRNYVIPDDVKELAVPVLSHRLVASVEAKVNGTTAQEILEKIVKKTPVPVL